ncbi:hypothetical protein AMAG_15632 [Allomyces macrogynus ATCC 38327]|uniref:NAD(+) kinase n=1 Tax=Allomyces macrogynus (strain ATCC 38327) TaxID=578462 RepID=A0A0L0T9J2_ALLM3|nr:hypothetical protein AMAG_15632 [Allomyces macrogynus ATCC 38327]|eukprot:KNE71396.1 hypothetical protein AMAG_15632 [Allomyces macrogynus ATCC 38327]
MFTHHGVRITTETFQVLNELVVDRGPSAYMSQLELFGDERHLTTVQADGLVVSTPTGSTAYSLSAGGSIVHPKSLGLLVTPICPHNIFFRPMLLPDSMELEVRVPPTLPQHRPGSAPPISWVLPTPIINTSMWVL